MSCNEKTFKRCRWGCRNQHLKESLIRLGCVPNKSLILEFPDISIFKSKDLIRHFIRGYWDGDGCLSWGNKEHTLPCIGVIGTEDFLTELKHYLPLKFDYVLQQKSNSNTTTRQLTIGGKNAFELTKYLYSDATIYLQRKYEKYLEYCRLYEESCRGLSGNIGETPEMDNTEINSEIKESESSYSVEVETLLL